METRSLLAILLCTACSGASDDRGAAADTDGMTDGTSEAEAGSGSVSGSASSTGPGDDDDDTTGMPGTTGGEPETGTDPSESGSSESGEAGSSGSTSGGTSSGGEVAECGNGIVEGSELCDDGNGIGRDGCEADCSQTLNYAFVTSTPYSANLGGVAGADAICQAHADAAGLDGSFTAYLATEVTAAADRFEGAAGWMRPDDRPVAHTLEDLRVGNLLYPMEMTETGSLLGKGSAVLTGTDYGGSPAAEQTCGNWTSNTGVVRVGYADGTGSFWSTIGTSGCGSPNPIYCLGTDWDSELEVAEPEGRRMFLSSGFGLATGIDDADEACQAEADDHGLDGTFVAFASTLQEAASDRVDLDGEPWYRPDGVFIVEEAADLADGLLIAAPAVDLWGETFSNYGVWTGAGNPTSTATVSSSCDNYSDTNGTMIAGQTGRSADSFFAQFIGVSYCSSQNRLYCLEE